MSARKIAPPVDADAADDRARSAPAVDAVATTNATASAVSDDRDSLWKEVLEALFPQVIELLAPKLHALIDWSVPMEWLDKELQAVLRASAPAQGRRQADKLARVRLRSGRHITLMVHVEIEGRLSGLRALDVFSWRMLEYNVLFRRQEPRTGKTRLPPRVYSLGILIDQPARPAGTLPVLTLSYQDDFLDQQTRFTFPIVELESWRSRWAELESLAPTNPFAVIIMAQLQASRYRRKATRLEPLLDLHRRLYGYGYTRDRIGQLLRLVEGMMTLPPYLAEGYLQAAKQIEQEHHMAYVTIAERFYTKQGMEKGQAELLLGQIERRFGRLDNATTQRINTADGQALRVWSLNILDADTLDDVFRD